MNGSPKMSMFGLVVSIAQNCESTNVNGRRKGSLFWMMSDRWMRRVCKRTSSAVTSSNIFGNYGQIARAVMQTRLGTHCAQLKQQTIEDLDARGSLSSLIRKDHIVNLITSIMFNSVPAKYWVRSPWNSTFIRFNWWPNMGMTAFILLRARPIGLSGESYFIYNIFENCLSIRNYV